MLRCHRLTTALEVINFWPIFKTGLTQISKQSINFENLLKTLCVLSTNDSKGFVAVVINDKKVEGFCIMEDVTPIFTPGKQFLCRGFYHQSGNVASTQFLMEFFEDWAREHHVSSYSVTTERQSGAAIRCFKSEKYGFKRSYFQFTKQL